jgi:hypothetical protein
MVYICKLLMNYVLGKRIFNILNHVIFPTKIQISKPIDVSVFMFDLRMINMSSECEYDWYWKISACSTEYEVCDSVASLTRQQTSYSGSACWYFRYQSIHIQITYIYFSWWVNVIYVWTFLMLLGIGWACWQCEN